MSEIKALTELKEWADKVIGSCFTGMTAKDVRAICDAIQAEVDERFMELPLDADGVPIRVGDKVQFRNDAPVTVDSIGTSKVYVNDSGFFGSNGGFYGQGTLKNVHHVKPRTLEDVLREFNYSHRAYMNHGYMDYDGTDEHVVAKYAAEIRELLGVDA